MTAQTGRNPTRLMSGKRVRATLYWIVSFPVLLETAVGIQWDLARIPYVVDILTRLGFPLYFATILGISKILALVALLAPRTPRLKEWAYAGLLFVYVGQARATSPSGTVSARSPRHWSWRRSPSPPGPCARQPAGIPPRWPCPRGPGPSVGQLDLGRHSQVTDRSEPAQP
jgi:hypothetical protein